MGCCCAPVAVDGSCALLAAAHSCYASRMWHADRSSVTAVGLLCGTRSAWCVTLPPLGPRSACSLPHVVGGQLVPALPVVGGRLPQAHLSGAGGGPL